MDPKLFISQVSYRPVNIYITGEVKTPGYYNLSANEEEGKSIKKLFDAIQIADGITNYANLSKISVIRNNSNSQGGGKLKQNLVYYLFSMKGINLKHKTTMGIQ